MPPDQPTDAGKDRETIKRILRERYEDLAFSPGDAYTRVVDAIAQALAAARAEGLAAGWDACRQWMKEGRYAE